MRNVKCAVALTALILCVGMLFNACERKTTEPEPVAPAGSLLGTNGLSASERQKFYHIPEGSELYPYAWAKALISSKTSKPFLENLERFGLIPDPQSEDNPHGLPIGITVAKRRGIGDIQMIGVNCTACHVGQFNYKGRDFRVDGAPNLFDIEMFYGELAESTQEMVKDPDKLWTFVKRYLAEKEAPAESVTAAPASASGKQGEARSYKLGDGTRKLLASFGDFKAMADKGPLEKALAVKIQAVVKEEIEKAESDETSSVDPLDQAKKELNASLDNDVASLADKEAAAGSPLYTTDAGKRKGLLREILSDIKTNVALFRSYIKLFKSLAGAGRDPKDTLGGFGRVDAFGSARFLMFGLANRQPTTAPVSYPYLWGMEKTQWLHYNANTNSVVERNIGQALGLGATFDPKTFETTVIIENTRDLEWLAYRITPPVWPEELFGKANVEKAGRGKELYEQNCARCHDVYETTSEGLDNYQRFSFEEIGTDRNQAENFHHPLTLNGQSASFGEENGKVLDQIKVAYYKKYNITPDQQKKWEGNRTPIVWRDVLSTEHPTVYRARPLAGIWATAPYLHNGSVPTLYALLLPGDKRPTKFFVGNREYDSRDLGYVTTKGPISFEFDSSAAGNSNRGHEYGTSLTDDERYSLLEYIKTLK